LDEAQREEEKCQQEYNDAEHALTIHQEWISLILYL
jgi:hypothetical protein